MSDPQIDMSTVEPIPRVGDRWQCEEAHLAKHLERARAFLAGHRWVASVDEAHLGLEAEDIVYVFLFALTPTREDIDRRLWVVVGDLPSVYLVTDDAPTPDEALARYIELMQDWVDAVRGRGDLAQCYPVPVAPTEEHAAMLESRLGLLTAWLSEEGVEAE